MQGAARLARQCTDALEYWVNNPKSLAAKVAIEECFESSDGAWSRLIRNKCSSLPTHQGWENSHVFAVSIARRTVFELLTRTVNSSDSLQEQASNLSSTIGKRREIAAGIMKFAEEMSTFPGVVPKPKKTGSIIDLTHDVVPGYAQLTRQPGDTNEFDTLKESVIVILLFGSKKDITATVKDVKQKVKNEGRVPVGFRTAAAFWRQVYEHLRKMKQFVALSASSYFLSYLNAVLSYCMDKVALIRSRVATKPAPKRRNSKKKQK